MRIAVLGAGAMGALFGGYLSRENDVYLIDVNSALVEKISKEGVVINEQDGSQTVLFPKVITNSSSQKPVDLMIVFVKSMFTISALENNKHLIGKDTYLMTLQNGLGHEDKLLQFADEDHVIIGSTQHNSSIISLGHINHGGGGQTSIGLLTKNNEFVKEVSDNFTKCGFECKTAENVKKQIWNKLFLNTAASSLTAVFQVPLGFIYENEYANNLMKQLCKEAVDVANAEGLDFNYEEVLNTIQTVLKNANGGYTSIYADVRDGRMSEVDTISGSVIAVAKKHGIKACLHEVIVAIIHALENRNSNNRI